MGGVPGMLGTGGEREWLKARAHVAMKWAVFLRF